MKTRILALVVALAMVIGLLPTLASAADEPITLQWYYINDDGRTATDDDFLKKEIEETFNVKLEMVGRPGPEQATWYQEEIAAGTEFDYYEGGGLGMTAYKEYVDAGLVMPLDRAMIEENMPHLMAYYEKFSEAFGGDIFKWYNIDGKIYSIPETRPGDAQRNVIGIRGDWLEAVGLEIPKTIADFEAVMDAFTFGDPDGNGIDDTFGFTGVNWNQFSLSALCQAFGFNIDTWYINKEGKAVYGTVQPEMKDMLELLQKWYKAGYFPCEFWNQDWDPFQSQMNSSVAGMTIQSFDSFINPNDWATSELLKTNPDAYYVLSYGMEGPNGDNGVLQFNPVTFAGIMFSYKLEDQPEKVKKYMQVFDALLFDPEWTAKATYGEEGIGYEVDAEGNYVQINGESTNGITVTAATTAAADMIKQLQEFINDPSYDRSFSAVNAPEYTAKANEAFANAHGIYDIASSATAARPVWAQYKTALNDIINNYVPQLISGERPLDDFDRMVEEWYAAGGQEVVDEMNAIFGI